MSCVAADTSLPGDVHLHLSLNPKGEGLAWYPAVTARVLGLGSSVLTATCRRTGGGGHGAPFSLHPTEARGGAAKDANCMSQTVIP